MTCLRREKGNFELVKLHVSVITWKAYDIFSFEVYIDLVDAESLRPWSEDRTDNLTTQVN